MCAAPDRSSRNFNSTKRRKLFADEGGTTAELTPKMRSVSISDEERGERRTCATSSKSVDADKYVVEEGSCGSSHKYADEVHALQSPDDEGLGKDCKTHSDSVGDVTPKRNLRMRTPLKNSDPKVGTGFVNGEREWSTKDKERLISILENDGFDGDPAKLAQKLPNQSAETVRYLIKKCEQEREQPDWEVMLNTKIEELRVMEGPDLSENLPLYFQLRSLFGTHPHPSLVGGVGYSAIYAYVASLMRGQVPKQLNPMTRAKLSQVFHLFKQRILAEPNVPMSQFERKAGSDIEKKKELKKRRSTEWLDGELNAKETLLSGDAARVEKFYLSHASLNPF